MSMFEKLSKRGAAKPAESSKSNIQRFFGVVQSYDVASTPKSVTVQVQGTEEVRKVHLDMSEKTIASLNLKEGLKRPDIDAYANRGKSKTEIGGTLLFEGAAPEADGSWKARWISSAVYAPNTGAAVTYPEARVGALIESTNGKPYRTVDVLAPEGAKRIANRVELDAALRDAVATHGNAFIRAANVETGKTKVITLSGGDTESPLDTRMLRVTSKDGYQEWAAALEHISDKDVVEVVPMKRIMFGGDTASKGSLDDKFTQTGPQGARYSKGFTEIMVITQARDDGSEFVTGAIPLNYKPEFSHAGKSFDPASATPVQHHDTDVATDAGERPSDAELEGLDLADYLAQQSDDFAPSAPQNGPRM